MNCRCAKKKSNTGGMTTLAAMIKCVFTEYSALKVGCISENVKRCLTKK